MYQPLEKTGDLIRSINEMVASGVNDIQLARIQRETDALEKSGLYVEAQQVRGMIAALKKDVPEVVRKFDAAVSASGGLTGVMMNYALAMSNVHRFIEAVALADRAEVKAPDDPRLLREALDIHVQAINAEGARRVMKRIQALGIAQPQHLIDVELVEAKDDILSAAGASWQDVAERVALISELLWDRGFNTTMVRESVADDGILCLYCLDASPEQLAAAEGVILDMIAEMPYSPVDSVVSFGCSVQHRHELRS